MKVVSGRLAVMEQQLGVTISDDGKKLLGFHLANLLNDMLQAGHFNVSFSTIADNIGSCDDSGYFGAYRLLNDNESDASLFLLSDSNCDRMSPFEAGKVFIDQSSSILMIRKLEPPQVRFTNLLGGTPPLIGLIILTLMFVILAGIVIARNVRVQMLRLMKKQPLNGKTKSQSGPRCSGSL